MALALQLACDSRSRAPARPDAVRGANENFGHAVQDARSEGAVPVALPDYFPKEVPVYPTLTLRSAVRMELHSPGTGWEYDFRVVGDTPDTPDAVIRFYRATRGLNVDVGEAAPHTVRLTEASHRTGAEVTAEAAAPALTRGSIHAWSR